MKKQIIAVIAALLLGFSGAYLARAQDQGDQGLDPSQAQVPVQNSQAPPNAPAEADTDAGVARVGFIQGDVSMQRGDSGDWSAVTTNTPLMAGDKIATNDGSRAELQLDYANVLRLDRNSQANIATLTRTRIQLQLAQGVANYSVLRDSQADVEIDTPNVTVRPLDEGRYRIEVNANGDSQVVIRDGEAEISTSEGSTKVKKGDLITIQGAGSDAQYRVSNAPSLDDWDKWNKDRDGIILHARSWQDTSPYYTGSQDLDNYGAWSEVPDYGPVWVPSVAAGWAPYRAGRWVWEPVYGWTWVSDEPWGWAPYHYGRWFLYGSSWAWWPGPIYPGYRPLWAPAYVSFFGFGGGGFGVGVGFGAGFGFGSIGWLPIGPCDYFHPWWGGYRDRFNVVNVNNIYNIHDGIGPLHGGDRFSNLHGVLTNDRVRASVSSVAAGSFGRGSIAARGVTADEFRQGRMMTGNVPVVPTRDSLRASDRLVSPSMTARGNTQQHFYSTRAPAARPQPFSQQASHMQEAIQGAGRFNGSANATPMSAGRPASDSASSRGTAPSFRPSAQGQAGRTFEAQGAAQGAAMGAQGRATQGQSSDGWQRFGSGRPGGAQQQPSSRTAEPYSRMEQNQGRSNNYRPPLDMSKPVINPHSSGAYQGGYRNAPSGSYSGGYRGVPSAPSGSYGGGYRSAPSGGGNYRGSSGGSSGGRSSGGGGGHHR